MTFNVGDKCLVLDNNKTIEIVEVETWGGWDYLGNDGIAYDEYELERM